MSLRFFAGGGMPPPSHEILRLEPDGSGCYLTGMPWPAQPPFAEIGTYDSSLPPEEYERLARLGRDLLAEVPAAARRLDSGSESLTLDGSQAAWGPRERPRPALALVDAVREVIAAARDRPVAVVRAELERDVVLVRNRGVRALPVTGGELRVGWGRPDHIPSPLHFAEAERRAFELRSELTPGGTVELALPDGARDLEPLSDRDPASLYAIVHVRWHPGVVGEDSELDGWMIAGPGRRR